MRAETRVEWHAPHFKQVWYDNAQMHVNPFGKLTTHLTVNGAKNRAVRVRFMLRTSESALRTKRRINDSGTSTYSVELVQVSVSLFILFSLSFVLVFPMVQMKRLLSFFGWLCCVYARHPFHCCAPYVFDSAFKQRSFYPVFLFSHRLLQQ